MDVTHIKLTDKCLSAILDPIKPNDSEMKMPIGCSSKSEVIFIADNSTATVDDASCSDSWITVDNVVLKQSDRAFLLDTNGMLNDKHINAGQAPFSKYSWVAKYITSAEGNRSFIIKCTTSGVLTRALDSCLHS